MKLLVDTNVLLDYYEKREPYYQDWKDLLLLRIINNTELWASAKSFTDIHYVASKQLGSKAIQRSLVDSLSFLNVCSIDGNDVKRAAKLEWNDFEDCIIYQAALKTRADYIVTRNTKDFEESKIPAVTPQELLNEIHKKMKIVIEGDE